MAGHLRSVDTGKARQTPSGRARRVREHLPPGQVALAKRRKQHLGARAAAADRIARTTDPLRQLDIAREYVRSAAAKYTATDAVLQVAVQALLQVGDQVFTTGTPVSASTKRTRRQSAERHRQQRQRNQLLLREGRAAVRRQQSESRTAS
ncbi:hypothetical protein GCM10010174_80920 [Kutzneria viridogrisea]|uniref:Uncharacterized protein n=1 Tax=Kutzneria viridogrisea TaxID=47990 RepID=A0ABR6BZS9_9PSEU|nr:hypothetical protein [Kutzneria viridogrisea]